MAAFDEIRERAYANALTEKDVEYLRGLLTDPAAERENIAECTSGVVSFVIRAGQSEKREQRELVERLRDKLERLMAYEADPDLAAHVLFSLAHGWRSAPRYYDVVVAALRGLPWDSEYQEMAETAARVAIYYVEETPTVELIELLLRRAKDPPDRGLRAVEIRNLAFKAFHPLLDEWSDLTPQQQVQYAATQTFTHAQLEAAAQRFLDRARAGRGG